MSVILRAGTKSLFFENSDHHARIPLITASEQLCPWGPKCPWGQAKLPCLAHSLCVFLSSELFSHSSSYSYIDKPQVFLLLFKYEARSGDITHIHPTNICKVPVHKVCFTCQFRLPGSLTWTLAKTSSLAFLPLFSSASCPQSLMLLKGPS